MEVTGSQPSANPDELHYYLETAEFAARRAGALLLRMQGRVEVREKAPADLVTEADLASQKLIAEILSERCPDHTIQAEEQGLTLDTANPWRWIVDPLDGTMNYAHGLSFWTVSIALSIAGSSLLVSFITHRWTICGAANGLGRAKWLADACESCPLNYRCVAGDGVSNQLQRGRGSSVGLVSPTEHR